jgi:hypothetical protein
MKQWGISIIYLGLTTFENCIILHCSNWLLPIVLSRVRRAIADWSGKRVYASTMELETASKEIGAGSERPESFETRLHRSCEEVEVGTRQGIGAYA